MNEDSVRYMRLLIFFDLPVKTDRQRSRANRFRRILIKNGFHMLQWSIYSRVCRGEDGIVKYAQRIKKHVPLEGNVRMMPVTEKQFARMEILTGECSPEEKIGCKQLLLF